MRTLVRITALLEGISFLVILFVTMPLKYFYDNGDPNKAVGMAHGILFVLYVVVVLMAASEFKWSRKNTFLALLASIIPFGTFWADVKIFRYHAPKL